VEGRAFDAVLGPVRGHSNEARTGRPWLVDKTIRLHIVTYIAEADDCKMKLT
jgi:hypothetical protein